MRTSQVQMEMIKVLSRPGHSNKSKLRLGIEHMYHTVQQATLC